MPIPRSPSHFFVSVDVPETLDRRSTEILRRLKEWCEPGMLYDDREIHEYLKTTDINIWLAKQRYHRIHLIDRRYTCVSAVLHNLWRNGLIKKLATGTYIRNDGPIGVAWRIVDERIHLSVDRKVQS